MWHVLHTDMTGMPLCKVENLKNEVRVPLQISFNRYLIRLTQYRFGVRSQHWLKTIQQNFGSLNISLNTQNCRLSRVKPQQSLQNRLTLWQMHIESKHNLQLTSNFLKLRRNHPVGNELACSRDASLNVRENRIWLAKFNSEVLSQNSHFWEYRVYRPNFK